MIIKSTEPGTFVRRIKSDWTYRPSGCTVRRDEICVLIKNETPGKIDVLNSQGELVEGGSPESFILLVDDE